MEEHKKNYILQQKPDLLQTIRPTTPLLTHLEAINIFWRTDIEQVKARTTDSEKVDELLAIISTRTNGYEALVRALEQEHQTGAVNILKNLYKRKPAPLKLQHPPWFIANTPNAKYLQEYFKHHQLISQPCVLITHDVTFSIKRITEMLNVCFDEITSDNKHKAELALDKKRLKIYSKSEFTNNEKQIQKELSEIMATNNTTEPSKILSEYIIWNDLTADGKQHVLQQKIVFQKCLVEVNSLVRILARETNNEENEFQKLLNDKVLIDLVMGKTPEILPGNIPIATRFYIPRTLLPKTRIHRSIFGITTNEESHDILIVKGLMYYELTSLVQTYGSRISNSSVVSTASKEICNEAITAKVILYETKTDFDRICKIAGSRSVHLLECVKNTELDSGYIEQLIWVKSYGSIDALHKFVHNVQTKMTEEAVFRQHCNERSTPVVFSGSQGMGKSSVMMKFASRAMKYMSHAFQENPQTGNSISGNTSNQFSYTQYIRANDFLRSLEKEKPPHQISPKNYKNNIVSTLIQACCTTSTGKKILRTMLLNKDQSQKLSIQLFFDGVDDLHKKDFDIMIEVVKFLAYGCSFTAKLWVTTRPYRLPLFESALSVLGYMVTPLEEHEQVELLQNYWKEKGANCDKIENVARDCLQRINRKVSEEKHDAAGTPLLCTLIAKAYEVDAIIKAEEENVDRKISDSTITKIYTTFIENSIQMHNSVENRNVVVGYHMEQAVCFLFPNLCEKIKGVFNSDSHLKYNDMLKFGILEPMQLSGSIRFFHTTFAKYFAAKAAIELMIRLTNTSISSEESRNLLDILLCLLREMLFWEQTKVQLTKIALHSPCINSYVFTYFGTCYFLNYFIDSTICVDNFEYILLTYSKTKTKKPIEILYPVLVAAVRANFTKLSNLLISLYLKTYFDDNVSNNKFEQQRLRNLFYIAAIFSTDSLHHLCNTWKDYTDVSPISFKVDIDRNARKQLERLTLLHVAVEAGKSRAVSYLLEKVCQDVLINPAIASEFSKIFHHCLIKSTSDPKLVVRKKIEILNQLVLTFKESLLQKQQFAEIILEQMHVNLLTSFVTILNQFHLLQTKKDVKMFDKFEDREIEIHFPSKQMVTNSYGENILHLLGTTYYDPEMNPKTYHDTLLLLEKNIDLRLHLLARNNCDWRAVDVAVSCMNLLPETLALFKKHGIKFHEKDFRGSNMLHKAIAGQRSEKFISLLIDHEAKLKCKKRLRETVLHVAASFYNYEAVKYFISLDPNIVNCKDNEGNTAFQKCIKLKPKSLHSVVPVISMIESRTVDEAFSCYGNEKWEKISKYRIYYQTALDTEPSNQHKIVSFLLQNGAKLDTKNLIGRTPLHYSLQICLSGMSKPEKRLLRKRLRKNKLFKQETLTLVLKGLILNNKFGSVWHPSLIDSFARKLVKLNADVNYKQPITGASLLHLAAEKHSYFGVKCLVETFNFDLIICDKQNRIPIQYMKCNVTDCNAYNCKETRSYLRTGPGIEYEPM